VPVRLHALGIFHQYAEHPILSARLACTGSGSEAVTDPPAGQAIDGGRTSGVNVNGSTATAASASCSLTFDTAHLVILDALIVFGLPSLFSLGRLRDGLARALAGVPRRAAVTARDEDPAPEPVVGLAPEPPCGEVCSHSQRAYGSRLLVGWLVYSWLRALLLSWSLLQLWTPGPAGRE
jgi:hypothetical protein